MGGLITRAYLLKNRDVAKRTKLIYFFSTPTSGSETASLARRISSNPQFRGMQPMKPADYVANLLRNWLAADFPIPSYCAYEKRRTYGLDVVTLDSASNLCTKRLDPIDADHEDIVKPSGPDDVSHLALKTAYAREMGAPGGLQSEGAQQEFMAILNRLKFLLLRQREELFPQIDEYIRNQEPSAREWTLIRETAEGLLDDLDRDIRRSMEFDAQFFEQGNRILLLSKDAREVVDRSYYNVFKASRQAQRSRSMTLRRMISAPKPSEARAWRKELQGYYDQLSRELDRLLTLAIRRS
jgi:hypothetical protein